jgi:thioredoxin type arsenate reductase
MSRPEIRQAHEEDLPKIEKLLEEESLPTLAVAEHLDNYRVVKNGDTVIGAIGLEVYDGTALLRSAVVSPDERGKGIGALLYDTIVKYARELGVQRLLLLTNTAEEYFRRRGFRAIDQQSVTGPVTTSVEFTGACPSHAVCMELSLLKKVLIVCTGNSCRSQMAEGWLRHFGEGKIEAYSAGTRPATVHPLAIQVMSETGIDISSHRAKSVGEFLKENLDYVVTVCDNALEECPIIPGNHAKMHMPFEDPSGFVGTNEERLVQFRKVRDQIAKSIEKLASSIIVQEAS